MPVLRAALVCLVGVVLVAAPPRARAETAEAQVERLAADAVNAYRGADYNRAVELLQKAYEIRQVPALLYNMAKAYDKLGDVEHAEDAYRRYVASLDADPKLKAKAEARVATLDEQRRKNAAAERAVETPKPPSGRVESSPPKRLEPHAPTTTTTTPLTTTTTTTPAAPLTAEQRHDQIVAERGNDRRRARWAALGLGVTTVALGGVALGLSLSALSLQSQWTAQYGGDEDTRRALKSQALVRAGVADGFYALTAAAAAVTAYFLYRGFRHEPAASLALSASPAGAYIGAQGHF